MAAPASLPVDDTPSRRRADCIGRGAGFGRPAPLEAHASFAPRDAARRAPAAGGAVPAADLAPDRTSSSDAARELGDDVRARRVATGEDACVMTSHPDHARSLFTADPELAPSLTGESPLRPIVGPNSVLTLLGTEHMRQRKLLLPQLPRRGGRALHGDDRRGRRARDRLAGRWASRSRSRRRCRRSRSR